MRAELLRRAAWRWFHPILFEPFHGFRKGAMWAFTWGSLSGAGHVKTAHSMVRRCVPTEEVRLFGQSKARSRNVMFWEQGHPYKLLFCPFQFVGREIAFAQEGRHKPNRRFYASPSEKPSWQSLEEKCNKHVGVAFMFIGVGFRFPKACLQEIKHAHVHAHEDAHGIKQNHTHTRSNSA